MNAMLMIKMMANVMMAVVNVFYVYYKDAIRSLLWIGWTSSSDGSGCISYAVDSVESIAKLRVPHQAASFLSTLPSHLYIAS